MGKTAPAHEVAGESSQVGGPQVVDHLRARACACTRVLETFPAAGKESKPRPHPLRAGRTVASRPRGSGLDNHEGTGGPNAREWPWSGVLHSCVGRQRAGLPPGVACPPWFRRPQSPWRDTLPQPASGDGGWLLAAHRGPRAGLGAAHLSRHLNLTATRQLPLSR